MQICCSLESLYEFILLKEMCENVFLKPCKILLLFKKKIVGMVTHGFNAYFSVVMLNISYMHFGFVYLLQIVSSCL